MAKKEVGWAGYPEPWLGQRQGALLGQTWVARSPLCSLKFFLEHNSVPGGQRTIPFYRHRGCKAPLRQPNKQVCGHGVSAHFPSCASLAFHPPWSHLTPLTPPPPYTLGFHPTQQPQQPTLHSFSPLCPHCSFRLCPCPSSSSSNVTLPIGRSDLSIGESLSGPSQAPCTIHEGLVIRAQPYFSHRKAGPVHSHPSTSAPGPWGSQHSVNVCLIESGQAASSRPGPG